MTDTLETTMKTITDRLREWYGRSIGAAVCSERCEFEDAVNEIDDIERKYKQVLVEANELYYDRIEGLEDLVIEMYADLKNFEYADAYSTDALQRFKKKARALGVDV